MLRKILIFVLHQRQLTKVAAITSVLALVLAFIALAQNSPYIMIGACVISGFAAGFTISAWRHSPRNRPKDRESAHDRRRTDAPVPHALAR